MRRLTAAGLFALVLLTTPSLAHAQQSLNLSIGGFVPRGEDARVREGGRSNDVLVNNLDFLVFDLPEFSGLTANVEYLVGLGEHLDAGLGVGLYRQTVPSVYADFVNVNGAEIQQDLRLRIVPFTATVRFLPFGRSAAFHPYIGAGLGVFNWRYSESGEFVDFSDHSIFRDSFVGRGTATGPVILGGVRVPAGLVDVGGEVRYQNAAGDLPRSEDFSADKIDLGGWTYLMTFNIRF